MKTEIINSLALALFDIAESADDGGTTSNLAFDLAEKAGWRWRDDEQFCAWALGATEAECAREGKRRFLVNQVALSFTSRLKGYLGDRWAKIESGEAHPNDLCDANQLLIDAFAEVCGREPFFPWDVEEKMATQANLDSDFDTLESIWDRAKQQWANALIETK